METVTIKTTKKVEIEKEMAIPSFWRSGIYLYKLISKDKCVMLRALTNTDNDEYLGGGVSISHAELILTFDDTIEITEQEFNNELNILTNKFLSL